MSVLQIILSVLSALTAVVLVVHIVRDSRPGNVVLAGLLALEAGLLVQLVWGLAMVFDDHAGVSVVTYVGYLVGALAVLPIGYAWSSSERSRSGTGVLLVAVLVLPVLFLRLHDIWSTHA